MVGRLQSWLMLQRWRLRKQTRGVWNALVRAVQIRLLQLQPAERLASVLPLIVLAGTLTACATTSAPPSTLPRNPTPPPSALPPSPPDYLGDALRNIEEWRKQLQGLTPSPAN
jgi:hypothetical protein